MSRRDGITFANTNAARNKQTVSGNLWKLKEKFFDISRDKAICILTDIEEHGEGMSCETVSALASAVRNNVESMDDMCMHIIDSVENEEHNANSLQGYDAKEVGAT